MKTSTAFGLIYRRRNGKRKPKHGTQQKKKNCFSYRNPSNEKHTQTAKKKREQPATYIQWKVIGKMMIVSSRSATEKEEKMKNNRKL